MDKTTLRPEDIKDEMCVCGHLKTAHRDTAYERFNGSCSVYLCGCIRFTWKSFVLKEKKLLRKISLI